MASASRLNASSTRRSWASSGSLGAGERDVPRLHQHVILLIIRMIGCMSSSAIDSRLQPIGDLLNQQRAAVGRRADGRQQGQV